MNDETTTACGPAAAEEETAAAEALIPQLPNDIALQIIARIPRWQHPYLSLISKSWRSTLVSPGLFLTRSLLHTTYQSLYLNLRLNNNINNNNNNKNNNNPSSSSSFFHWHLVHQTNNNRLLLSPLPPNSSQPIGSAFAVIPPKFYLIGGSLNEIPSNNIWVFDCRLNQWSLGPKMRVAREFAAAGVVDGKIYVMGGCVSDCYVKSMNWCEVLDPVVGAWMPVASPVGVRDKWMHASCVIDGRIYAMADRGGVVYDAVVGDWGNGVPKRLDLGWRGRGAVVDRVLYCYDFLGKIRGYNVDKDMWEELRGVDKSLPKFLCGATMVSLNGRLCVVWERKGGKKEVEIMCAEIDVWKNEEGGLNGSVLWSDVILRIPFGSSIVHCLAVDF